MSEERQDSIWLEIFFINNLNNLVAGLKQVYFSTLFFRDCLVYKVNLVFIYSVRPIFAAYITAESFGLQLPNNHCHFIVMGGNFFNVMNIYGLLKIDYFIKPILINFELMWRKCDDYSVARSLNICQETVFLSMPRAGRNFFLLDTHNRRLSSKISLLFSIEPNMSSCYGSFILKAILASKTLLRNFYLRSIYHLNNVYLMTNPNFPACSHFRNKFYFW